MELATSELTNQPNALEIKEFLKVAGSNLNEYAAILFNPELSTSVEMFGYAAHLRTAREEVLISFWPDTNRLPCLVRDIERIVIEAPHRRHVVLSQPSHRLRGFPAKRALASGWDRATRHGYENKMPKTEANEV